MSDFLFSDPQFPKTPKLRAMHDIEAPGPQPKRSPRSSRSNKDSSHDDDYSDRRKSTKRNHSKKSFKTKPHSMPNLLEEEKLELGEIEAPRPRSTSSLRSSRRNLKDSSRDDDYSDRRKSMKRSHSKRSFKTKPHSMPNLLKEEKLEPGEIEAPRPRSTNSLRSSKRNLKDSSGDGDYSYRRKSMKRSHSKRSFKTKKSIPDLKDEKRELEEFASQRSSRLFSLAEDQLHSVMRHQKYSKQEIKEQTKDIDEAFLMYGYAETSARKIQLAFRERQQAKLDADKSVTSTTENESEESTKGIEKDDDEDVSQKAWYTLLFFIACFLCTSIPKFLVCCTNLLGGDDTGAVDAAANAAMQPGGGGGAVGPTPTGGEAGAAGGGAQAGAQGAMAAQAASSAASGAASGVASGAAAGAAASSAAAAATAGATAAAAGATQVATVVAVSTAAAAAAATTAVVVNNSTPEPILSICGLANPDIRSGRMVMFFEGLPRRFDDRESGLVENLVMQSYNELTLGTNVAVTGCLDPLAREMQSIKIVNQTLSLGTGDLDPNNLEVIFEAQVSCDRCSFTSPLFSEEQEEASGNINGNSTTNASGDNTTTDFDTVPNATTEGVVLSDDEQSRQLSLSIDFTSQTFFQKLIQLVILDTEELSDEGELPEGFVQISKALVVVTTEEKEEETLVTEIKYKRQTSTVNDGGSSGGANDGGGSGGTGSSGGGSGGGGSSGNGGDSDGDRGNIMAAFEFEYVDESGEVQKETIEITEEGASIPTTAFPTFQPSHTPTDTPSSVPTNVFSGQPTQLPSVNPSEIPSVSPSESPSSVPSVVPSEAPSEVPSVIPSEVPSQIPSFVPSDAPSSSPSMTPSEVPSFVPSEAPSFVPSFVPSEVPSFVPSESPSEVPSEVPSFVPSEVPSFVPSEVPSDTPSSSPSSVPSANPSASPSDNPSAAPSSSPSAAPSPNPSSSPTAMYIGCFADQDVSRPAPDNGPRSFSYVYTYPSIMSDVNTCRSHCRGLNFAYAGLQVGNECWCHNSPPTYGGASNCNEFFCGGLECGGQWALAVYLSGY